MSQTEELADLFFQIGKALAALPPEQHQTYLEALRKELSGKNYDGVKHTDELKDIYTEKFAQSLEINKPKEAAEKLPQPNLRDAFFKGYKSVKSKTENETPENHTAQIKRS